MCQATTGDGKRCRRKGDPFCPAHQPEGGPNRAAFDVLVGSLQSREALLAPWPLVELARTLADAIDAGSQAVSCPKCKHELSATQSAPLVKQYRELVERLAVDGSRDDDADIWERFHNAGRS